VHGGLEHERVQLPQGATRELVGVAAFIAEAPDS
jgi:hypothetical protein